MIESAAIMLTTFVMEMSCKTKTAFKIEHVPGHKSSTERVTAALDKNLIMQS
jgi:hypothetical protein